MKNILLVFGTRPEAIKMAPLVLALKKCVDRYNIKVCVTGQHREMLDQVLDLFQIVPDYDLNIMQPQQDLYDISSKILVGLRDVLKDCRPNIVLVHGDTTTSMMGALAAFYQQIPVGHIEAGLRTGKIYSPWPEEMNRLMTSKIATYHFAPTYLAKQNLLDENICEKQIVVTGNTVIDALYWVVDRLKREDYLLKQVKSEILKRGYNLDRLNGQRRMVLITGHRRENFGEGFVDICYAIERLAKQYPNVDFVYPVHLNPNVRQPVMKILGHHLDNIFLLNPLEYLSFVYMMERSYLILTDSGGIQEEAPSLGKPVLVMRDSTERPEAIDAGTVCLIGTNQDKIVSKMMDLLDDRNAIYQKMACAINPYGDGYATERIIQYLDTIL